LFKEILFAMKRVILIVLALIFTLSFSFTFCAEESIPLSIVCGEGGLDEEVTVSINVGADSKTTSGMFAISYDPERLEFVSYETGKVLASAIHDSNAKTPGILKIAYILIKPVTAEGEMFKIKFKIRSSESNEIPVTLEVLEFFYTNDAEGKTYDIQHTIENDSVTVKKLAADVNNDGAVDQADKQALIDYLLGRSDTAAKFDFNGDGICDITDLVQLNSVLALVGK